MFRVPGTRARGMIYPFNTYNTKRNKRARDCCGDDDDDDDGKTYYPAGRTCRFHGRLASAMSPSDNGVLYYARARAFLLRADVPGDVIGRHARTATDEDPRRRQSAPTRSMFTTAIITVLDRTGAYTCTYERQARVHLGRTRGRGKVGDLKSDTCRRVITFMLGLSFVIITT